MVASLKSMLTGQNQFASGGLLLMIIGGLSVYLRAVPQRLWYWLVDQTTMMITVKDDDAAFLWVKEWFLEQNFLQRIRRVDLDTTMRGERVALIPAPGSHWFWYGGRPFVAFFFRSEKHPGAVSEADRIVDVQNTREKAALSPAFRGRCGGMPPEEAGRTVVSVRIQRWLGFGGRLCPAVAGLGNLAVR